MGATSQSSELQDAQFFSRFWSEFLEELVLDYAAQAPARATSRRNIDFPLPPSRRSARLSACFTRGHERIGVYLRLAKDDFGATAYQRLSEDREVIERELKDDAVWEAQQQTIGIRKEIDDVAAPEARDEIKRFFADTINRFVNVLRPRLERMLDLERGLDRGQTPGFDPGV